MLFEISEIKNIRKKLGITQSELSKLSGASQSLIAKIESRQIDPSYSKAKKLIETLHSISGKEELLCKDIMARKIISVNPDDNVNNVIKLMKKHDISQMPVITGQNSVGLISEAILLDALVDGKTEATISDIMGDSPPVISANANVRMASELLKFCPVVLVSEQGALKGIITKSDVIQKAYKKG